MNLNDIKSLAKRVHVDFHTPAIEWERAMQEFNAQEYVSILKNANLNSIVSFTKCHHGYSYYNTEIGLRHPSLPEGLDMFGEILEECHKNDMKVLAYYSVGWLTTIQKFKPEWMERNIKGETINTIGVPTTGPWANICLNSPYAEEVIFPELKEIGLKYDVDGWWIDIIECQPCHCDYCKEKYRNMYGKELPENDAELEDFVVQTKLNFIHSCKELCKSVRPDAAFTYNTAGRDRKLVEEVDFCSIETHPGAPRDKDAWTRALLTYKFLQKYDKPWESCTSRFIHGWGGWDDQSLENMLSVGSRILAHGGMINLGDQNYPTAALDAELYKKFGKYFTFMGEREDYALGSKPVPYVAVMTKPFDVYAEKNDVYFGVVKILSQAHIPFDIIDETMYDELSNYECIVLPEIGELSEQGIESIKEYVKNGGRILATGNSSYRDGILELGEVYGCEFVGKSKYSISYLKVADEIGNNMRRSPFLIPGSMDIVAPNEDVTCWAEVYNPVIEPCYEDFMIFRNRRLSPPGDAVENPGVLYHNYGKGSSVYIPANIFTIFQAEEQWYLGDLIKNIMDNLLPVKKIELVAPKSVEINVTKLEDAFVCHLIQYQTQNEACHVGEIMPVYDITLKVSLDLVEKTLPIMVPAGEIISKVEGDFIEVTIPKLETYQQIVFKVK